MAETDSNPPKKHQSLWLLAVILALILAVGLAAAYLHKRGATSYDYSYMSSQQKQVVLPASKSANKATLTAPSQYTEQAHNIKSPHLIMVHNIKYKGQSV